MHNKNSNSKNFYFKAFLTSFSLISIVYSFMIFQFWWGNHDWDFLKDGIMLKDGFFEARYSQHLPTALFFTGQILPPVMFITIFALLALLGLLIAKYLQIPQKIHYYVLFTLILTVQPHTPILFYYVFISLPLVFWGCFGVSLLFLSSPPFKSWKFTLGSFGFFFLLGSYPPILALLFTLFIAQRIQKYIFAQETPKETLKNAIFYLIQLLLAGIFYKLIIFCLTQIGAVNTLMYNTSLKSIKDIFLSLFSEPFTYFSRFNEIYQTLGFSYISLLYIPLIAAITIIFKYAKNKIWIILLIFALLITSRLPFTLSDNAYLAPFRISWWGQTALIAFSLSVILQNNKIWLKNITLTYLTFLLLIFVRTDFTIQKTQYFAFQSERLFQKRVEERLFSLPDFDINREYATLNFGYPDFHRHFCIPDCSGFDNELLSHTILPADFGSIIFWDEIKKPTILRYGYWSQRLWIVHDKHTAYKTFSYTEEEMAKLHQWMYFSAQKYPHKEAIYLNNSLLLFYFDSIFFNRNKEDIFRNLKNYK